MFKFTKHNAHADYEEDLAHAGKLLVVRLWLAGAVVTAATALVHFPLGH